MNNKTNNNNNNNTKMIMYNNNNNVKSSHGRKTFAFWTLVCLLLFLAFGNLMLTLTIIGVLRLGYGMNSLQLIPEASTLKFFGHTDLGHVYKINGKLNGFADVPVEIETNGGSISFNTIKQTTNRPSNKLTMNRNGILLNHTGTFTIRNGMDDVFSTVNPSLKPLNVPPEQLIAQIAHTNRITSYYNGSLEFRSDRGVNLKGNEGTRIESKEIIWSADQNIHFQSENGSIILSGAAVIDLKHIPIVSRYNDDNYSAQFKLCVCYPRGKLFKIPQQFAKINCNHIKMISNPCM